ncbi:hypothetical protein M758_11G093200, partial [Ceratodon purpureus]
MLRMLVLLAPWTPTNTLVTVRSISTTKGVALCHRHPLILKSLSILMSRKKLKLSPRHDYHTRCHRLFMTSSPRRRVLLRYPREVGQNCWGRAEKRKTVSVARGGDTGQCLSRVLFFIADCVLITPATASSSTQYAIFLQERPTFILVHPKRRTANIRPRSSA